MLTSQYCDNQTILNTDKYSLRPRTSIRKGRKHQSTNIDLINNYEIKLKNSELQQQQSQTTATSIQQQNKIQKKAPPLSKYRRKTANARERSRMREINYAFEALRRAVPHIFVLQCPSLNNHACSNQPNATPSEKLTKITTLRLAMRYINALSSVLNNNNSNMLNNNNEQQINDDQHDVDLDTACGGTFMELSDESTSSLSLCNDNLYDDQHHRASSLMSIDSRQSLVSNMYDDQLSLLDQNNLTYLSTDVSACLDFTDQSLSPTDFTEQHSLSPFDELFETTF